VSFGLVILDCDGVLVDSEPTANRVFAAALNELGLAIGYEEVCREFVGLTMERCVEILEARLGRPVPDGFVAELERRTFDAFREELEPVRGVEQALDAIDVPVCVASSGEPHKMRFTLGLTGLLPRFDGRLFSALEVGRGKPFPDLFLHAARSMGVPAERTAVVEDSVPGVQAARAAGMRVFGYAERTEGARLAEAGAVVFDEMRRLPGLIAAGPAGAEKERGA
jgi:HAD superfamily hydrolase (TIGR01509 family)